MPWQSMSRRTKFLLIISVIFIFSLAYLWLNFKVSSYQDWRIPESSLRPLSRRKPTLHSDEYYHGSGPSLVNLADLLAHCIVALKLGGRQVVKASPHSHDNYDQLATRSKGKTLEGADDLITEADYRSHVEILALLGESYPRLNVVSEEADAEERNYGFKHPNGSLSVSRRELASMLHESKESLGRSPMLAIENTIVWIDPLDATKEFSEGLNQYVTLMACIVSKGIPVAGVIYKPFNNKLYWSWISPNHGRHFHSPDLSAALNEASSKEPRNEELDSYNIIISRSHAGDLENVIRSSHIGHKSKVIPAGGSGYKTIQLLSGHADAYVHMTRIKKWDICAPYAILGSVKEAKMTDLRGKNISFDNPQDKVATQGVIATSKATVHNEMLKLIDKIIEQ